MEAAEKVVKKKIMRDGRVQVTGTKHLRATQTYPRGFFNTAAEYHANHLMQERCSKNIILGCNSYCNPYTCIISTYAHIHRVTHTIICRHTDKTKQRQQEGRDEFELDWQTLADAASVPVDTGMQIVKLVHMCVYEYTLLTQRNKKTLRICIYTYVHICTSTQVINHISGETPYIIHIRRIYL